MSVSVERKTSLSSNPPRSPIAAVVLSCRSAFIGVALISGLINLLMLTGSLFMMQVYDRVLGSQSIPTLVLLALITMAAYLFQGGLDIARTRILALAGERVDEEIGPKVHAAVVDLPLRLPRSAHESLQPFRDIEAVRGFLAGPGPVALFDIPWMPIYLAVLLAIHWSVAALTIAGAVVLIALTWVTEIKSRQPTQETLEAQSMRNQTADADAAQCRSRPRHGLDAGPHRPLARARTPPTWPPNAA